MQDINTCTFSGRLTKDVELRRVGEGEKAFSAITFTLAVNRKAKKNAQGNYESEADFINFSATGVLAENIAKYCHKGDELFVANCRYQSRSYTKNGQKEYYNDFVVTEAHFVSKSTAKTNGAQGTADQPDPVFANVETTDIDINMTQFPWD